MAKQTFGSKAGLIAATVGSAVGLGNIWRFPAEVQANGGGAFLLVYILCVFLLGVPVMMGEFALGRGGRGDTISVYRRLAPGKPWWLTGVLGLLASYTILSFYLVVAGWTLEYLVSSVTGDLYATIPGDAPGSSAQFAHRMAEYVATPVKPVVFTILLIVINAVVLLGGVQKGIEKMSNLLMPVLFLLLILFCCVSLSLPEAGEGVTFFLKPDFSKITPGVCIDALGQAFFSLSLGMGTLVTYSSYFPKDTRLGRTAVTVSALDLLVALMMGIVIFPAVMSFGLANESFEGATLVFVTLPEVFMQMPGTQAWSILFFLLLLIAAVTSTISLAEVAVAFAADRYFKGNRRKSLLLVLLPLLIVSPLCSLSNGVLSHVTIFGQTLFNFLDTFSTNILLPLVGLTMCIYLGWFAPRGFLEEELTNRGAIRSLWPRVAMVLLRYVAPLLILLIFISRFA
ncbi:MAG: sodium-dependent transporter [Muribaculaceae bacterium]|nr:sodium-dependent transporter [Muribaculaceae bacterium]